MAASPGSLPGTKRASLGGGTAFPGPNDRAPIVIAGVTAASAGSGAGSLQNSARVRECERDHEAGASPSPDRSPRRSPRRSESKPAHSPVPRRASGGPLPVAVGTPSGSKAPSETHSRRESKASSAASEAGSARDVTAAATAAGEKRTKGEIRIGPPPAGSPERAPATQAAAGARERVPGSGVPSAIGLSSAAAATKQARAVDGERTASGRVAAAEEKSASGRSAAQPGTTPSAVPGPTTPGSGSAKARSKKPGASKKAQAVVQEQHALADAANNAAALLREKQELEARIAAKEAARAAEEEHVARVTEADTLLTEAASDAVFARERQSALVKLEEAVYEAQEWDRYLSCNPLPDVRDTPSLNAYVSVFRESDRANPPHLLLKPALDACAFTQDVVGQLERVWASAREDRNEAAALRAEQYTFLLRSLAAAKLDDLTCRFLHRTDEYEQGEEQAFTVAYSTSTAGDGTPGTGGASLGYGLWVHNSSRTNRIKRVDFVELGVSIELPQSLQKARTAIRLVRTPYDHVSVARAEGIDRQSSTKGLGGSAASSTSSLSAAGSSRPGTRGDGLKGGGSSTGGQSGLAFAAEEAFTDPTSLFDFQSRPPPRSSRAHFVSVGGVLDLSQLLLPVPAKKIRSWTLREMTPLEKQLVVVPYPLEGGDKEAQAAGGAAGAAAAAAAAAASSAAPLRLKFSMPPHIFLPDQREPLFGFWDGNAERGRGAWKQDGMSILGWDAKTRQVSLSLPTIKPLALIQPRALDFPYRAWNVIPLRDEELEDDAAAAGSSRDEEVDPIAVASRPYACRLEVLGSRFPVSFDVHGLVARLAGPRHKALESFRAWTNPGQLLSALSEVGVRVQPTDEDAQYCRKPLKNPVLVQALHNHLALLTQVFDIQHSAHNVSRPVNAVVMRVRINKHSSLLQSAAARKAIRAWEAQNEADEAADRPDESWKNFPDALREKSMDPAEARRRRDDPTLSEDERRAAAVAAEIDAMEADDRKEEAARKARADAEAAAAARQKEEDDAAWRASQAAAAAVKKERKGMAFLDPPTPAETPRAPPPPPLSAEQRYEKGYEWVTVLAELIEAPEDPVLASKAAAATQPHTALPTTGRALTAAERATGSVYENLPAGALIKFTLIVGDAKDGSCDSTPLPGCTPHFSLRRALLQWFHDKTPHDLLTAMSMAAPDTNKGEGADQFHFVPFEPLVLQTQQTVRRMLNLLRPFIFC